MSADNIGTPVESSKGSEHSLPSDIPHLNEKSREELADAAAMDGLATETANRSVVIRGLPRDVRERELRNLVVLLPGYESSQLHQENEEMFEGIVTFETSSDAQEAAARINGIDFDRDTILEAYMGMNGSSPEKGSGSSSSPVITKQQGTMKEHSSEAMSAKTSLQQPVQSSPGFPIPSSGPSVGGLIPMPMASPIPMTAFPAARAYAPVKNEKDNPPINTLFIGNLGENVDEGELLAVFGSQPGFMQLKVVRSAKGTSAFVEFADVASAHMCHDSQQGLILSTSDRGPIRVQFSKNPFGRKRDGSSGGLSGLTSGPGIAAGVPSGGPQAHGLHTFAPGPTFVPVPQPVLPGTYAAPPFAMPPLATTAAVYGQPGTAVMASSHEMRDA